MTGLPPILSRARFGQLPTLSTDSFLPRIGQDRRSPNMWKAISFALLSVCCFQWAAPQAIKPKLPDDRPTTGRSHDVARWAGHVADAKLSDRLLVDCVRVNDFADAGGGETQAVANVPDAEDRARAIRGSRVTYGGGSRGRDGHVDICACSPNSWRFMPIRTTGSSTRRPTGRTCSDFCPLPARKRFACGFASRPPRNLRRIPTSDFRSRSA